MKKQVLALMTALMLVTGGCLNADAATNAKNDASPAVKEVQTKAPDMQKPPCKGEFKGGPGQPPPKFDGKCPHGGQFAPPPKPSKEEMEARKAAFEKRLNLTEEQKKQAEANRQKDRAKMEPIMKKIHANREEFFKIKNDTSLSEADKNKKIEKLRKERKDLQMKADKCHKENMAKFEALLTPEQKVEFEKIKAEKKAEREKFKMQHPRPEGPKPAEKPVKK